MENTLTGERHFSGDSLDPCSAVRAVPLSEEDGEVGGDGAARVGDGSSPAVKRGGWHDRSPKTASVSRRRRCGGGVADPRTTTPGGGGERRRGALFGSEGGERSSDRGQVDLQAQGEVAQSLGSAGNALGASPTTVGVSDTSHVVTGGRSSARQGAPVQATADAAPTAAGARDKGHRVCAMQQHVKLAKAAGHLVGAKFTTCAATLYALGKNLRGRGLASDEQQVLAAMIELWGAIDALGTFEGAHTAAIKASTHALPASPSAEAEGVPAWLFAPGATRAPEQASCDDCAESMPEWLAQAALILAADTDAAASSVVTMTHETGAPGAATSSTPAPVGGRHARRRRYCAAIRLQAGARATIARRRVTSLRATDRSAARSVLTAAAHPRVVAQQISARAAAAEREPEGARLLRERQDRAATRLQVFARLGTRRLRNRRMDSAIAIALTRLRALTCLQAVVRRRAAQRVRAAAAEATAAAEAAAAEEGMEAGLGDHWSAVARAQCQLAALMQVDPLSMMSQVEHNLAATRLRWATARAAEAGRTAQVAQATEPPIATDAPT